MSHYCKTLSAIFGGSIVRTIFNFEPFAKLGLPKNNHKTAIHFAKTGLLLLENLDRTLDRMEYTRKSNL